MAIKSYADITPTEPEWLWPGKIPMGMLTMVAGQGGVGKGFMDSDLVARVTRGEDMPDGTPGPGEGCVIMVTSEDDPAMATAWRLMAAGADMSRVIDMTEDFTLPQSIGALRDKIKEVNALSKLPRSSQDYRPNVLAVFIDPLADVLGVSPSNNRQIQLSSGNATLRKYIVRPLESVARDYGIGLVVINHLTKGGRVAGTKGLTDAARQVLKVYRPRGDADPVRVLAVEKTNIASDLAGNAAYTITGKFPNTHVQWLDNPDLPVIGKTREPSVQDRVLSALEKAATDKAGDRTAVDLASDLDVSYGAVKTALSRLKSSGRVESGDTPHGWRLATLQPVALAS